MGTRETRFPAGWNEDRVRRVLQHYEQQGEDEAVAEDEAAGEAPALSLMEVPRDLVPVVRYMISKQRKASTA